MVFSNFKQYGDFHIATNSHLCYRDKDAARYGILDGVHPDNNALLASKPEEFSHKEAICLDTDRATQRSNFETHDLDSYKKPFGGKFKNE